MDQELGAGQRREYSHKNWTKEMGQITYQLGKENRYLNRNLKIKELQEKEKLAKFLNKNRFVVKLRL